MRLVFMGTPEFAAPTLCALAEAGHEISLVVTQPDRARGRGRKTLATPCKVAAQGPGLAVFQPVRLHDPGVIEKLTEAAPEAIVVVAYGELLKPEVLNLPSLGCVNGHASLLPRHRGAAPIQHAILVGDQVTGVTTMLMNEGLDTGEILLRREVEIAPDDTSGSLSDKLSSVTAELVVETLAGLEQGAVTPEPQNDALATYASKLAKADGRIDWSQPAAKIALMVRAFDPWPGTFAEVAGERTKVLKAAAEPSDDSSTPGTILSANKSGIRVACGQGVLRVLELQPPGKKGMNTAGYLAGRALKVYDLLK